MSHSGYGYSVWYVPENYKELQERYGIQHIPHITLETNLILRDAFHIYRNAAINVEITYMPQMIKFAQCYEHDPLQGFGWNVYVPVMKNRKPNWKPHMSVKYFKRGENYSRVDWECKAPLDKVKCFIVIADTRSIEPSEWSIDKKYFCLKASSGFMLESMDRDEKPLRNTITTDEYFAVDTSNTDEIKRQVEALLLDRGLCLTENHIETIVGHLCKSIKINLTTN